MKETICKSDTMETLFPPSRNARPTPRFTRGNKVKFARWVTPAPGGDAPFWSVLESEVCDINWDDGEGWVVQVATDWQCGRVQALPEAAFIQDDEWVIGGTLGSQGLNKRLVKDACRYAYWVRNSIIQTP